MDSTKKSRSRVVAWGGVTLLQSHRIIYNYWTNGLKLAVNKSVPLPVMHSIPTVLQRLGMRTNPNGRLLVIAIQETSQWFVMVGSHMAPPTARANRYPLASRRKPPNGLVPLSFASSSKPRKMYPPDGSENPLFSGRWSKP